jgi:hypothetical protein
MTAKALDLHRPIAEKFNLPPFSWYGDQHHDGVITVRGQRIMEVRPLKLL